MGERTLVTGGRPERTERVGKSWPEKDGLRVEPDGDMEMGAGVGDVREVMKVLSDSPFASSSTSFSSCAFCGCGDNGTDGSGPRALLRPNMDGAIPPASSPPVGTFGNRSKAGGGDSSSAITSEMDGVRFVPVADAARFGDDVRTV